MKKEVKEPISGLTMKKILHILILVTFLAGAIVMSPASHAFGFDALCADSHCEDMVVGDNGDESSSSDAPHNCTHCHHHNQMMDVAVSSTINISTEEKAYIANPLFVVSSLVYGLKRPPRTIA